MSSNNGPLLEPNFRGHESRREKKDTPDLGKKQKFMQAKDPPTKILHPRRSATVNPMPLEELQSYLDRKADHSNVRISKAVIENKSCLVEDYPIYGLKAINRMVPMINVSISNQPQYMEQLSSLKSTIVIQRIFETKASSVDPADYGVGTPWEINASVWSPNEIKHASITIDTGSGCNAVSRKFINSNMDFVHSTFKWNDPFKLQINGWTIYERR